jgi:predicted CDP-diglyceride synthetase/phosphatidate cytidylyltransferase
MSSFIWGLLNSFNEITYTSMLNKFTASRSPYFTTDSTLNSSVCSLFIITHALVLIRVNSVCLMNYAGTLYFGKHSTILFLNTGPKDCV